MKLILPVIVCLSFSLTQKTAPTFYLPGLNGNSFFASEHYGEKSREPQVTVISFFATWCGPCQKEIKILDRLKLKYPTIAFYLINYKENEDTISKWQTKIKTSLPVLLDRYGLVAEKFDGVIVRNEGKKSAVLPTLFVIDKQGKIIHTHSGFEEKDVILLEEILKSHED